MPIIAKGNSGNFTPAPAGTFRCVCVDVIDLGLVKQTWNGEEKQSHKIRVVWQIDENMEDGKPFMASNMYTLSLDPKANLRKLIEGWLSSSVTSEVEAQGFDVEELIGRSGILTVVHRVTPKGTYANVASVAPLMKGMPALEASGYTRKINRAPSDATPTEYDDRNPPPIDEDPFV